MKMKIRERGRREIDTKILYLCDRKRQKCSEHKICGTVIEKNGCAYTTDIEHAKNFEKINCNNKVVFVEKEVNSEIK